MTVRQPSLQQLAEFTQACVAAGGELIGEVATLKAQNAELVAALRALVDRLNACELGPVHSGLEIADTLAAEVQTARAALAKVTP